MSIYSNVTVQDLINLPKIADRQKNQRAFKIKKKRIVKQTHEFNLALSLSTTRTLEDVINLLKI